MDTTKNSDDNRIEDEYRDIVAGLRSIPPVGPRLAFRLKVAWRSRATTGVGKEPTTGISGKKRTAWPPLARAAAVAMLTVLIGASIFFGLTLLATGSHPGETLYVFKVAREKISMAFTGGPVATAEKSLGLAQERLKELDYFVSKKNLEPEKIEYIAKQYNRNKIQVQKVIAQKGTAPDGKMLASQLENLETQKEGILSRMSATAGPESILAPAAGARVQLLDPSGSPSLGDRSSNASGQADSAGIFEFDYTSSDKSRIPEIEATVELDGQKTIVPVFASGESEPVTKGRLEVKVEPRKTDLIRGQTEQFILTLNSKGGEKLGGTRMVLEDRSGASLIDGQSGIVELVADDDGRCAFTVTKTSNHVSRISLGVFDGT
ncbi:MAG: hypothetical protein JJE48_08775, partial [Actinobacteria bacterium]|nr:hypothetical protein [Actinomycetota bacterium]